MLGDEVEGPDGHLKLIGSKMEPHHPIGQQGQPQAELHQPLAPQGGDHHPLAGHCLLPRCGDFIFETIKKVSE